MLKVIKRVLRLSGDLSKRIYASFVFSFIDSIVAMFPVGAVFYTLTKIQNNKAFAGNDWLVLFGILIISLVVRMVFKYLVYSFQSTAGFEFVSRERITLGDKLRNVGMGFFHERNMGDITTTVSITDFRFRRGTGFFKPCGYPHCFILYFQFCRGNGANDRHDTLHGSKP